MHASFCILINFLCKNWVAPAKLCIFHASALSAHFLILLFLSGGIAYENAEREMYGNEITGA